MATYTRLAALASVFVVCGCTSEVEPTRAEIVPPDEAMLVDAGAPMIVADVSDEQSLPAVSVQCTDGFDPFVCGGSCPAGMGCCISGIRPTGVCSYLDECGLRCVVDCTGAAASRSTREGIQCFRLCTWVSPSPTCSPDP